MSKVKVLIVDDSVLIRKVLSEMFATETRIEVVGTASDPFIAREKIKQLNPDVITLDVEMPKMDGITFLKNLMRLRPMPVVMISTLTQQGAPVTLEALELGAVDYVGKPSNHDSASLAQYRDVIIEKVLAAATANVKRLEAQSQRKVDPSVKKPAPSVSRMKLRTDYIIAVGASTGGTEAIREFLMTMPPDSPPMVITQHIPPVFSTSFAERMNRLFELTVLEASNGDRLMPGHVYIAPGDKHLALSRSGTGGYSCKVYSGDPVNRHMPSVEVLFNSVAELCRGRAVGVMLTGMGADGAKAMVEMKNTGCFTIIQDEETSVVWGMPGAVFKLGGADKVLPLPKIGDNIIQFLQKGTAKAR